MAFGIKRQDIEQWKRKIDEGQIAFLTHYWLDDRFPGCSTVTKAGCRDLKKLADWGSQYGLKREWIHKRDEGYSHFDLLGEKQREILAAEGIEDRMAQIARSKPHNRDSLHSKQ